MIVTKKWINDHKSKNSGFSKSQLNALGISWPPVKGWVDKIVGKEITEEQRKTFERHSV
jgi:hypothetical protein